MPGEDAGQPTRSVLAWALLVLASLASAATLALLVYLAYLVLESYSGGNSSTSLSGLLFLVAVVYAVVFGIPAFLVSAALWVGYALIMRRRRRRAAGPDGPGNRGDGPGAAGLPTTD